MAKKKGTVEPGWDKIGEMIGKKMEKGMKKGDCCGSWMKWANNCGGNGDNGFFGRTLFIIGVLIALNTLGVFHGVATWVIVLIGIGFALMKF